MSEGLSSLKGLQMLSRAGIISGKAHYMLRFLTTPATESYYGVGTETLEGEGSQRQCQSFQHSAQPSILQNPPTTEYHRPPTPSEYRAVRSALSRKMSKLSSKQRLPRVSPVFARVPREPLEGGVQSLLSLSRQRSAQPLPKKGKKPPAFRPSLPPPARAQTASHKSREPGVGYYTPKYNLVQKSTPSLPLATSLPFHRSVIQYQTLLNFKIQDVRISPRKPSKRKLNKALQFSRRHNNDEINVEVQPPLAQSESPRQSTRRFSRQQTNLHDQSDSGRADQLSSHRDSATFVKTISMFKDDSPQTSGTLLKKALQRSMTNAYKEEPEEQMPSERHQQKKKKVGIKGLLRKAIKSSKSRSPFEQKRKGVKGFVSFEKMLGRTIKLPENYGSDVDQSRDELNQSRRIGVGKSVEPFARATQRKPLFQVSPYAQDYDIREAADKFKFTKHCSELRFGDHTPR